MSSPRIRRVQSDYDRMKRRFADFPLIKIASAEGVPPEKYLITYNVKGLSAEPDGTLRERDQHTLEVNLTLGYPRRPPQCKLLTPIFHPNITESTVCTGDFYAASEGLDDLVIRIGRMIAYQEYNVKSPLNGLAARWAEKNNAKLPVDARELAPPQAGGGGPVTSAGPPPLPRQQGHLVEVGGSGGLAGGRLADSEETLRVTAEHRLAALQQHIEDAWRSERFDRAEELLREYGRISQDVPESLQRVRDCLQAERFIFNCRQACDSAMAKIDGRAFSAAVSELEALQDPPASAPAQYGDRLADAQRTVGETRKKALDGWLRAVQEDVWRLCHGDSDAYKGMERAIDEIENIPIGKSARATIREQLRTEAGRIRATHLEKKIEQAFEDKAWNDALSLCEELLSVDAASVTAKKRREDTNRHMQEDLAASIKNAWSEGSFAAVQSLLQDYVKNWKGLPCELQHVQQCLDLEHFLKKCEEVCMASVAKQKQKAFSAAVAVIDGLPAPPQPVPQEYNQRLSAAQGAVARLREESITDWVAVMEDKVQRLCGGTAESYQQVDNAISEVGNIPISDERRKRVRETLRANAKRERIRVLESQIQEACQKRAWPAATDLCDELTRIDPKSAAASEYRARAEGGVRLDAGAVEAVDLLRNRSYAECANLCDRLINEHNAEDFRFAAKSFKGTLAELRETARKSEAEFLGALTSIQKASDANDWQAVGHWSGVARKLKPGDARVRTLVQQSAGKRARIRRRAAFRVSMRAAAAVVIVAVSIFGYRFTRLWQSFDSALTDGNEPAATDAAERMECAYGPAKWFLSARTERARFEAARQGAEEVVGHSRDGNWATAQKAFENARKAWHDREFSAASEQWGTARAYCQRVTRGAAPLTIVVSPVLADASVRLATPENQELCVERGARISLRASPGIYLLEVAHPDYAPRQEEVVVQDTGSDEILVRADLTPLPGTLVVRSTPKGEILEGEEIIGETGASLLLSAGNHDITIRAEHYASVSRSVFLAPNGQADLDVTLSALPRRLFVTCEPTATVFVDGQELGKTDENLSIPVGEHLLMLVADGYRQKAFKPTVVPGRDLQVNTTLELIPLPGKLRLACTPIARVFYDGHQVGYTDEAISLPVGEHRVELVADGYVKKALTVRIALGRDVEWSGVLKQIPGTLLVDATVPAVYGKPTSAPRAKLTIGDATKTVVLPHRETGLSPGKYRVEMEVEGYDDIPRNAVDVRSGEQIRLAISLVPKPASVCFVADPPDARLVIYSGNEELGRGGEKIELMPFKEHEVAFMAKGYESTSMRLTLPVAGRHHGDVKVNLQKSDDWR